MIYLIQYDRSIGVLVSIQEFQDKDRSLATNAKLDLEISLLGSPGTHEVVLLEAESEARLRKTHRRYFDSLENMRDKRGDSSGN